MVAKFQNLHSLAENRYYLLQYVFAKHQLLLCLVPNICFYVIFKSTAKKVKRIFDNRVVIGFAGSVADAFSLSEKFESMLNKYSGNLMRSAFFCDFFC